MTRIQILSLVVYVDKHKYYRGSMKTLTSVARTQPDDTVLVQSKSANDSGSNGREDEPIEHRNDMSLSKCKEPLRVVEGKDESDDNDNSELLPASEFGTTVRVPPRKPQ